MEVLSAQRPSLTVWHQLKSTMDTWVWITEAQTLAICLNIIIELEMNKQINTLINKKWYWYFS